MALRIPLSPGAFAGDYEILRLLSDSGGSALVYYASKNDRLYVLKEFYPSSLSRRLQRCEDGSLRLIRGSGEEWNRRMRRFESEAQNYAQLQREFASDIIPGARVQTESAYTFFCEAPVCANGTCYLPIVTRSGETLYSHALKLYNSNHESGIYLLRAFDIMLTMCDAVDRLHSLNRLHLDLKPDNLFITDGQLKLLDFGSMMSIGSSGSPRAYTLGFSAPELSWGEAYLSEEECVPCPPSDVFSICAIFYWMLFGEIRAEEDMCYDWELSLSQLSSQRFPAMLRGCGLNVINGCLNILQKGMSVHPSRRHESVSALKANLISVRRLLEKEIGASLQNVTANTFMDLVREVYAFRNELPPHCHQCIEEGCSDGSKKSKCDGNCLPVCQLMNSYIRRKIVDGVPLIANEMRPNGCITYVNEQLRTRNQYDEAMFALNFLKHHTNLELWHPNPLAQLYLGISDLAELLGRDDLGKEAYRMAEQYRDPRISEPSAEFKQLNACESAFDFGGMVAESRRIILEQWNPGCDVSDARSAVLSTILSYTPAPKMLVSHAGRYVEGLCLARSEGWQEDGTVILEHLLGHMEPVEDGFRARTVDNMLHFCIEANDRIRFLQTLRLLPSGREVPEALMRPSGRLLKWSGKRENRDYVEDWLIEVAERFAAGEKQAWFDSFQYMLYLYLQSVNTFFRKYLKSPRVEAALLQLCSTIHSTLRYIPVQHPKPLILKHAALIARALDKPELANKLRAQLFRSIRNDPVGIVRVISGGALLALDRTTDSWRPAFDSLVEDIRYGILDGKFHAELFLDAMEDPDALLNCFRFKHT